MRYARDRTETSPSCAVSSVHQKEFDMFIWILLAYVAASALMLFQVPGWAWLAAIVLWIAIGYGANVVGAVASAVLLILFGAPVVILATAALRRALVTPHIFGLFKRILPSMSDTERDALEAGTTWWDADLFSGRPDWKKFMG